MQTEVVQKYYNLIKGLASYFNGENCLHINLCTCADLYRGATHSDTGTIIYQ